MNFEQVKNLKDNLRTCQMEQVCYEATPTVRPILLGDHIVLRVIINRPFTPSRALPQVDLKTIITRHDE